MQAGRMKKAFLPVALSLLGLLSSGLCADESKTTEITKENVFTFYSKMKRLTEKPYEVSPQIASLCRVPAQETLDADKAVHGPHSAKKIQVYASEEATKAFTDKAASYPEGSIVVKEKLNYGNEVTAVAGMIKHAKGYDSEHGDWEYFYSERNGEVTKGKIESCMECHSRAKDSDYVVGTWAKGNEEKGK